MCWLIFIKLKIIYPKQLKCLRIQHSKNVDCSIRNYYLFYIWAFLKSLKFFFSSKISLTKISFFFFGNFYHLCFVVVARITTDNIDILTEIGILYLRINDTKGAFDKLFEVTKSHENCSKALLALGSILQVCKIKKSHLRHRLFN